MLRHPWDAQAHTRVGAEAEPHTGVMERLQVLLIDGDGCFVFRGRRQRKRPLAIGGIIELRANRGMQRALEEWLAHPGHASQNCRGV
jgi:hypothetical protein